MQRPNESEPVERDAIPKRFSSPQAARRRSTIIMGLVVATALTAPASFLVAATASSRAADAVAAVAETQVIAHRAFAESIAHRWAYGTGAVIGVDGPWQRDAGRPILTRETASALRLSAAFTQRPTGQGDLGAVHVAWDRAETVQLEDRMLEHHHFLVLTRDGLLELTVPVTETPTTPPRPALGGNPTVSPYLVDSGLADTPAAGWPAGWERRNTPANIASVAEEWAVAYAADDSRVLFRLSGDTDDSRAYRGLGGFELGDINIGRSGKRSDELTVTQITATYVNSFGVVLRVDHDLLVANADQPVPNIVAWGARGQGPQLFTYMNATRGGTSPLGGYGWIPDQTQSIDGATGADGTTGGFLESGSPDTDEEDSSAAENSEG